MIGMCFTQERVDNWMSRWPGCIRERLSVGVILQLKVSRGLSYSVLWDSLPQGKLSLTWGINPLADHGTPIGVSWSAILRQKQPDASVIMIGSKLGLGPVGRIWESPLVTRGSPSLAHQEAYIEMSEEGCRYATLLCGFAAKRHLALCGLFSL